jgi:DNA-directed RNA polymerases I, II, and III subunit RPABC5|tara:strand:+ start:2273 stop:2509 length:237 start_codon:yes stop_codon:yes gene_type:complete
MIIPVRCFTCGKVIGNLWNTYVELNKVQSTEETLDQLHLTKMCCRRMMITHVNLIDDIIKYNRYENTLNQKVNDVKKE